MKNEALYLNGKLNLEFGEAEMPVAAAGELVIKMEYVGICGSDAHFYETGYIGDTPITRPQILGHECAGVVYEIGEGVEGFAVGDKVTVEPGKSCGKCGYCKAGKYNLCRSMVFISSFPHHGAMRQYMSYPADLVYRLPDCVSALEGALIEPLAVGMYATRRSGVQYGDTVVILGAGCIGLMTLMACKAMTAVKTIVVDLFDARLGMAKKLGADVVINATDENVSAVIAKMTGLGADIVFEAAGSRHTMAQTTSLARPGGTVVVVGNVMGDTPFNFYWLAKKEINIIPVFRYRNIFPLAIAAVAEKKVDLNPLVSGVFDFCDAKTAFDKAVNDKVSTVKAVIKM